MIKDIIRGLIVCFAMYSAVPMRRLDWDNKNIKYAFCFFPLVGLVIGGAEYLWFSAAVALSLNGLFYAAIAAVIPTLISGGIHVDGLIDTCDAIFSYGDREKKLQILKDPHVGAFGVIYVIVYALITLGLFSQLYASGGSAMALIFIFSVSRGASGLITIRWSSAKASGLKYLFSEGADKRAVTVCLTLWLLVLIVTAALISLFAAIAASAGLILFYSWFYFYCKRQFGGLTGDLVGFSLCVAELILLSVLVFDGLL